MFAQYLKKWKASNQVSMTTNLLTLTLCLNTEDNATSVADILDDVALSSSWHKDVHSQKYQLNVLFENHHKEKIPGYIALVEMLLGFNLQTYEIATVEDRDWLKENQESFQPFVIGPFYIYGSHIESPNPESYIPLQVDAATAFGSGNHGSTKGCLLALEHISTHTYKNILDLGCGSGILGIAASKIWTDANIIASDFDPECVRVTAENCIINNAPQVTTLQSLGFQAPQVTKAAPYNLIIANILASVLTDLAPEVVAHLANGGDLILSGILNAQAEAIINLYEELGLSVTKQIIIEEWTTLILHK